MISDHSELISRIGDILFQKESPYGTITVGKGAFGQYENKALFINHRDMCHSNSNFTELFLGKVASFNLPENAEVLNIGLGCGFTASVVSSAKNLKTLDIVEINPIIVDACRHFSGENGNVLDNLKVKTHVCDGFQWLSTTKKIYHSIVLDVEEPSVPHSEFAYQNELFPVIKQKLHSGGNCAIWGMYVSDEFVKNFTNLVNHYFRFVRTYCFYFIENNITRYFVLCASNEVLPDYSKLIQDNELEKNRMKVEYVSPTADRMKIEDEELAEHFSVKKAFNFPDDYQEQKINNQLALDYLD